MAFVTKRNKNISFKLNPNNYNSSICSYYFSEVITFRLFSWLLLKLLWLLLLTALESLFSFKMTLLLQLELLLELLLLLKMGMSISVSFELECTTNRSTLTQCWRSLASEALSLKSSLSNECMVNVVESSSDGEITAFLSSIEPLVKQKNKNFLVYFFFWTNFLNYHSI